MNPYRKKNKKRFFSLLLIFTLLISLIFPQNTASASNASAISIKLSNYTGNNVTLSDKSGRSLSLLKNKKIYNGYFVQTGKGSTVYLSLDEKKAVKLDQNTKVEIKKQGRKNEINIIYGKLFFNVTQKLNSNESMNVRTSNLSMGIRGTIGEVEQAPKVDENGIVIGDLQRIQLYEGNVQVTYEKQDGTSENNTLNPGQQIEAGIQNNLFQIMTDHFTIEKLPVFVLEEFISDQSILERVSDTLINKNLELETVLEEAKKRESTETESVQKRKEQETEVLEENREVLYEEELKKAEIGEVRHKDSSEQESATTPSITPIPMPTPVSSSSTTSTPKPTKTPTVTPKPSNSPTVTPEPSGSPNVTPEPSNSPTVTPEPSGSPNVTPEPSNSPTVTPEPSFTPAPSPRPTPASSETIYVSDNEDSLVSKLNTALTSVEEVRLEADPSDSLVNISLDDAFTLPEGKFLVIGEHVSLDNTEYPFENNGDITNYGSNSLYLSGDLENKSTGLIRNLGKLEIKSIAQPESTGLPATRTKLINHGKILNETSGSIKFTGDCFFENEGTFQNEGKLEVQDSMLHNKSDAFMILNGTCNMNMKIRNLGNVTGSNTIGDNSVIVEATMIQFLDQNGTLLMSTQADPSIGMYELLSLTTLPELPAGSIGWDKYATELPIGETFIVNAVPQTEGNLISIFPKINDQGKYNTSLTLALDSLKQVDMIVTEIQNVTEFYNQTCNITITNDLTETEIVTIPYSVLNLNGHTIHFIDAQLKVQDLNIRDENVSNIQTGKITGEFTSSFLPGLLPSLIIFDKEENIKNLVLDDISMEVVNSTGRPAYAIYCSEENSAPQGTISLYNSKIKITNKDIYTNGNTGILINSSNTLLFIEGSTSITIGSNEDSSELVGIELQSVLNTYYDDTNGASITVSGSNANNTAFLLSESVSKSSINYNSNSSTWNIMHSATSLSAPHKWRL